VLRHSKGSAVSPQGEEEAMRLGRLDILPGAGGVAQAWSRRITRQDFINNNDFVALVAGAFGKYGRKTAGNAN
jgi:hypothetical protein